MIDLVQHTYVPHVHAARQRVATDPSIHTLLDPAIDPALFERFLIQYCSLGVYMTAPVEDWIRRAGEACQARGWSSVGNKLVKHAAHEADHHLLMIADTHALVDVWNQRGRTRLDAGQLLAQPPTAAVRDYVELHEQTIRGPLPIAQVAIEFEIERLSLVFAQPLVEQAKRLLGPQVVERLSFLTEHVELDVGHTALNERMLAQALTMIADIGPSLGEVGSQALDVYLRFVQDCLRMAEAGLSAPEVARAS